MIKEAISIPANINFLAEVRGFIQKIGQDYRFSKSVINSMMLSVEEACTNIMRHGYKNTNDGKILIEAIVHRLSLEIIIVDQGQTYDPRLAVRPAIKEIADSGKKGGLGILMIRKLMDEIDYSTEDRGNEFRLLKFRDDTDRSHLIHVWHFLHFNRFIIFAALINIIIVILIVFLIHYL